VEQQQMEDALNRAGIYQQVANLFPAAGGMIAEILLRAEKAETERNEWKARAEKAEAIANFNPSVEPWGGCNHETLENSVGICPECMWRAVKLLTLWWKKYKATKDIVSRVGMDSIVINAERIIKSHSSDDGREA